MHCFVWFNSHTHVYWGTLHAEMGTSLWTSWIVYKCKEWINHVYTRKCSVYRRLECFIVFRFNNWQIIVWLMDLLMLCMLLWQNVAVWCSVQLFTPIRNSVPYNGVLCSSPHLTKLGWIVDDTAKNLFKVLWLEAFFIPPGNANVVLFCTVVNVVVEATLATSVHVPLSQYFERENCVLALFI